MKSTSFEKDIANQVNELVIIKRRQSRLLERAKELVEGGAGFNGIGVSSNWLRDYENLEKDIGNL